MDDLILLMIGMSHDKSHDLRLCKETSCSKPNPKFHPVSLSLLFWGLQKEMLEAIGFLSFQMAALFFYLANIC